MVVLSQHVTNALSSVELPSTLLSVSPLSCFCCPTPHHPGTKLTLSELLRFTCTNGRKINIPVEISTKYLQFGTLLLDDRNGSKVKRLVYEHHYNVEKINTAILQEWLIGRGKQPVSWATLVEVLRDIELSTLADEIEAVKCSAGESINLYWSSAVYCVCVCWGENTVDQGIKYWSCLVEHLPCACLCNN